MVTTTLSNGCVYGVLREGAYRKTGVDVDLSDDEESRPTKRARTTLDQQPQAVSDVHCRCRTVQNIYLAPIEHLRRVPSMGIVSYTQKTRAVRAPWPCPVKSLPSRAVPNYNPSPPSFPRSTPSSNCRSSRNSVLPLSQFSGDFHLFSTSSGCIPPNILSRLNEPDLGTDSGPSNAYRILYGLLTGTTTNSPDARCFIPDNTERHSRNGFIQSELIKDPVSDERLGIGLHDIREIGDGGLLFPLSSSSDCTSRCHGLNVDMMESSPSIAPVPVTTATVTPICRSLYAGAHTVGDGSLGDIVDSFGEFAISRVWCGFSEKDNKSDNHVDFLDHRLMEEKEKEDNLPDLMELFRGHFSLRIYFGDGYVDRGCPEVGEHSVEFWAVRTVQEIKSGYIA
ncbi:hypothetical protein C8R41DRAFT_474683 [Lentinula lateritia]|uniref:Uncharacterized protein n=1 Tax=Lentinula lateritia TaxID=40482 RepID=A0ABQ8V9G3_9AGAR|nr:hypothetical protein C8R41DRAFT_474683 [Lentinula lateritia]